MPTINTTDKYIQSPTNPNASMPNPNYIPPTPITAPKYMPVPAGETKIPITAPTEMPATLSIPKTPTIEIDMSKAPALGVDTTDITTGIAGTLAQMQATIGQITEAMKGIKPTTPTEAETPKGAIATLAGLLGQRQAERAAMPSAAEQYEQTRQQIFQMYGMTPEVFQQQQAMIGQLTQYQKEIADLEAAKETRLLGAEQQYQGRLTDLLRGEQGLIERQYNSKIAAKSAQAAVVLYQYQLQQGQITQAMGMVDSIVKLQIYDQEQKLKDFDWAYNTYKDVITMWSDEEQKEWNKQYQTAQFEWEKAMDLERNKLAWTQEARLGKVEEGITPTEEPASAMRSMAQRYLTASPEEQARYIPTAPYQQADFWSEVDWLMSQQPELGGVQIEAEFQSDKVAGMPLESAISLYGKDLGEDWIKEQYKAEVAPTGKPLWRKALEWTTLPFTYPYQKLMGK